MNAYRCPHCDEDLTLADIIIVNDIVIGAGIGNSLERRPDLEERCVKCNHCDLDIPLSDLPHSVAELCLRIARYTERAAAAWAKRPDRNDLP